MSELDLLDKYKMMLRIRKFEETVADLRRTNDIVGSVHLCNGQEAIYAGVVSALDLPRDLVFPTYRGHGWAIACGAALDEMFAELLGRETGLNGGRAGSAYLSAPSVGMFGENSIVGAGTVIATGAALASQFDGSGRVVVAAIGEGAMNQGAVHEALNWSAVRSAPVVFVIENNGYSELTPTDSMARLAELYRRASPYGIKGIRVDGNNVESLATTMREVVRTVRDGNGPILVEAITERLVGHYIGDQQSYRPNGEVESAMNREPLVRTRARLLEILGDEDALFSVEGEAHREVQQARDTALAAPQARPEGVLEHLYA